MQDRFSPSLELAVLQSRTLPQLVQQDIERLILSGELRAGERLNEVAISRRLGVSRGPIREALRTLEEAGLLRFEKMRGMAVREITPEEAADIYQLRACLEALVCERAAARMSAEQLQCLSALVRDMDDAAASSDVARYHSLNVRFHEELVAIADSREFARFYRAVVKKLTLFRQRTLAQGMRSLCRTGSTTPFCATSPRRAEGGGASHAEAHPGEQRAHAEGPAGVPQEQAAARIRKREPGSAEREPCPSAPLGGMSAEP